MDKKKKIIWITIITIIIVAAIAAVIWYFVSNQNTNSDISKIKQLYETLADKTSYSFSTVLDDNNQAYYAKENDKAYTDTTYNGSQSKFIIRDGNSYLLMDDSKVYYTYRNNETDLKKVELGLETLKDMEYEKGEEKIDNKKYQYEEYATLTSFTMRDTSEITQSQEVKTRFYFKGDKLVYIKTMIGDKQELLKVEIKDKVDSNLFEIPSDYREM